MGTQQLSRAFASSSRSSSSVVSSKKYDVFLSFRGEDTRKNITGHLYEALTQKNVITFKDDRKLEKGDDISPALIEAIEGSHASIVIFSENYASSKWCLDELNKILECKKCQAQIVIPVFYNIDPSHVRKQTGSYAKAFAKHKRDRKLNKDKLPKWKAALTEAASLSGWDTRNRNEADLIKDIVKDVLQKLNGRYPPEVKRLVGIEKKCEQVESLLKIGSNDVRILGIWGMGGQGKTALASAVYAYVKLYPQFDGHWFLANVREELNKYGLRVVRNRLFSALLEEDLHLDAHYIDPFIVTRLARKKVFIVLDDVSTLEQIEDLILKNNWLGPGSRVIVTTRDKHIFNQVDECEIYEVKELNEHDSLQLFCLTTFREMHPTIGYEDLSRRAIAYCKGNPLALKVLGANLRSRSKEVWESELKKLQNIPNKEIHKVLKLSYDDLDSNQKQVFLDIACLLEGWQRDSVINLLEACNFFPTSEIEVLLEKSLITISPAHHIEMHDLLVEMGREIVIQESEDPGKRSRVWKSEEVYDLFKNYKGTEAVQCIRFNVTEVGDLHLSSDSFKRMTKLRYLEIYNNILKYSCNIYSLDGLEQLSGELRYFRWDGCSLESLPSTFHAEMLVELRMPGSKLKKLWDGVQNLGNLKKIHLSSSEDLIELPDLSKALNLEEVWLSYCSSLRELNSSFLSLPKLGRLFVRGCKRIESLKTNTQSKSLRTIDADGCSSLTEFLVTSEVMSELRLGFSTAIRELSPLIYNKVLDLRECNEPNIAGCIPSSLHSWEPINELSLFCCPQINESNLRLILDGIQYLEWLDLRECCNLEAVPDNIRKISTLIHLELDDCRKLVSIPELPPSLQVLTAINCTSLDTDSTQRTVLQITSPPEGCPERCPEGYETGNWNALFLLPGGQDPGEFGFHTTTAGASITIPRIQESDYGGFIICIIRSEGLNYSDFVNFHIYDHGRKIGSQSFRLPRYYNTFNSDHMLLLSYSPDMFIIRGRGDRILSLDFKFFVDEDLQKYFEEEIKGYGVLPIHASSKLDGSGRQEISDIDEESDMDDESDINDELQPIAIGGSNSEKSEDDQEQLLIPANKKRRVPSFFFILSLGVLIGFILNR